MLGDIDNRCVMGVPLTVAGEPVIGCVGLVSISIDIEYSTSQHPTHHLILGWPRYLRNDGHPRYLLHRLLIVLTQTRTAHVGPSDMSNTALPFPRLAI